MAFDRPFVRDPFTLLRVKFLLYYFEHWCLKSDSITEKDTFYLFCFQQIDFWRSRYQFFLRYQFFNYHQRFWSSLYAEQCRYYSTDDQSKESIRKEIVEKTSHVLYNRLMYDLITGSSWGDYMRLRRFHYLFYQKIKNNPLLVSFVEQLLPDQQYYLDWCFPILDDENFYHLWVKPFLTWRVLIYSYLFYPVNDYTFGEIFYISPNNYDSTIYDESHLLCKLTI